MIDRTRRKSAAWMTTRIVVTLAILLVATLVSQRLSETNVVTPEASQPIGYSYLANSAADVWHAFPTGR